MRALLQRVSHAGVEVAGETVGSIGAGLLIFLGVSPHDGEAEADFLAAKIAKLRIFNDAEGKMNLSIREVGGSALVVSQFTLYADLRRGNRPGYSGAAAPAQAEQLYDYFIKMLTAQSLTIASGVFSADMKVAFCNDGPVTLWLDTADLRKA